MAGIHEHIIRGQEDYERIAGYILANPENWEKDEENLTKKQGHNIP
jgi:hypothetical protein